MVQKIVKKTDKCICGVFVLTFGLFLFSSCSQTRFLKSKTLNAEISLGEQIKKVRINRGVTLQALASAADMSVESLELVESGLATPMPSKMVVLQEYLNAEFIYQNN